MKLEEAGAEVLEKEYVDLTVGGVKLRLGGMYEYAFGLNGNNGRPGGPGRRTGLSPGIPGYGPAENHDEPPAGQLYFRRRQSGVGYRSGNQRPQPTEARWLLPFAGGLYGGDQGWFPSQYAQRPISQGQPAAFYYQRPRNGQGKNSPGSITLRKLLFWTSHL